jgi:hypothetical protein
MGGDGLVPGSDRLCLIDVLPLLRPDEQGCEVMIKGWRNQQLARNLSPGYVNDQERTVRAFPRNLRQPHTVTPEPTSPSNTRHLNTRAHQSRGRITCEVENGTRPGPCLGHV